MLARYHKIQRNMLKASLVMGDVVSEKNQVNYIEGLSPFDEIYGGMIERSGR